MQIDELRIIVDEREKKSGIPKLLSTIGVKTEVKTLPIGDYIVAPETVVERKSISDLLSSIFDGRLFDQCNRLTEHYKHPILLVEGNVDEIEELTDNPLIFYGALSTVALEFKIPIIPTPNATHTAKLLVSLSTRKEVTKGPFLKKIKKSNNIEKQQLLVLSSLPGIGEKSAIRLLEKFGTPLDALCAPLQELAKTPGLGEAKAKKIKKMLQNKNKNFKKSGQKTLHES